MIGRIRLKDCLSNPWITFSPFLLVYLLVVVVLDEYAFRGDGTRYLMYARNLLRGYYSPPGEVVLWNGPGYPLFLTPFVALGLPPAAMTLANAVIQYLSVVFLYKTMRFYVSCGAALFFSLMWALHFTAYELMPMIMSETLTMFLVTLLSYFAGLSFRQESSSRLDLNLVIAGGVFGFLVLTKVIFSYVLFFMFAGALAGWIMSRDKHKFRKALVITLIAFTVNLPYLAYTFNLTGRPFYWADSGGMSLYWMSTPFEFEYGDWQSDDFNAGSFRGQDVEAIRRNHEADYAEIYRLTGAERDDLFKKKAMENIKNNPKKFLINWIANVNRLFFGFPNSFNYENLKFLKMFPNIFLVGFVFYSLAVSVFNLRRIPFEIWFLLVFGFIYLGLSSLVSAYPRMLLVIVPVLMIWIAYTVDRTVSFSLTFTSKSA